jgi:hypothetical protein
MPKLCGSTLLTRARRLADDTVEPYFIDDTEMYQYISEAERALAVAGRWLRSVIEYNVSKDDRWLNLGDSPELIEVRDGVLVDSSANRYPLKFLGTIDHAPTAAQSRNSDYGLITQSGQLKPGRPSALVLGKQTNQAELAPVSDADYTIELSVIHYPVNSIEIALDELSIPERHHQAVAVGAALFALEGSEHEHLNHKMSSLNSAWQRALIRASEESGDFNHDHGTVHFSNDLW